MIHFRRIISPPTVSVTGTIRILTLVDAWLGRQEKQKTSAQFSRTPRSNGLGASLYTPRTFS